MRRRITAAVRGDAICDGCGTSFEGERCPSCAQRRRRRAGLEAVIETYGNDRRWVIVERSDDFDGGRWEPTRVRDLAEDQGDNELEGWPW
jgi:hypothetical protein